MSLSLPIRVESMGGIPAYVRQFLAKLKALLRKAAARTVEALWDTIGALLNSEPMPAAAAGAVAARQGVR